MENFGYNPIYPSPPPFPLDAEAYAYQPTFSPPSSSMVMAGEAGFQAEDQPREKRRHGKKSTGGVRLSTDPQSVAARERRHRISNRFKILQSLVPGGSKLDTVSMLEEAIHYVKFLKAQIWLHQTVMASKDQDQNTNSSALAPLPCYAPAMADASAATATNSAETSVLFPPQQSFGCSWTPSPTFPTQPCCSFQGDQDEMFPYGSTSVYYN